MITVYDDEGEWHKLSHFYDKARREQERVHGDGYCNHHDAVVSLLPEGGTYLELGVHQGTSAAGVLLNSKLKKAVLVDNNLGMFRRLTSHLFRQYCSENDIELDVRQVDSSMVGSKEPCDVLLIDSLHTAKHLKKELSLHADNVRIGIVFHDTSLETDATIQPELWNTIQKFLTDNEEWVLRERFTESVGYTVIVRR